LPKVNSSLLASIIKKRTPWAFSFLLAAIGNFTWLLYHDATVLTLPGITPYGKALDPSMEDKKKAYARLILAQGVNLQPGQALAVRAELVHREFVHLLAEMAYEIGARLVDVDWTDLTLDRIRLRGSYPEYLDHAPNYLTARYQERLETNWATISIVGREDPHIFDDIEATAMQRLQKATRSKLKAWYAGVMANQIAWCVCAAPTPQWAKQVFPTTATAEAVDKLWTAILAATHADADDPVVAWQTHLQKLQAVVDFLHARQVRTLHFVDTEPGPDGKPGTNLTIGLTDHPYWITGASQSGTGVEFSPNIPTEEAFSTPHKDRTEGWVRTSMPFFTLEQKVENAYFRFEHGAVVEFQAEHGQDVLAEFFAVEGTRYLGEIALVDVTSPIYRSGILFHDTLFDENAASHVAFGKAYPGGTAGGDALSEAELSELGVNESPLHQDIMFGTPTMQVTAICADGSQTLVMENGQYVPEIFA
jgi:aminopeptidase